MSKQGPDGRGPTLAQLVEGNPLAQRFVDGFKWPDPNATRSEVAQFELGHAATAKNERAAREQKATPPPFDCPDCHHKHQGAALAFICIGCPCPRTALEKTDTLTHSARYCAPYAVERREAAVNLALVAGVVGVCVDEECDLSGGYAHAGPCEACDCPLRHARAECPQSTPLRDPHAAEAR